MGRKQIETRKMQRTPFKISREWRRPDVSNPLVRRQTATFLTAVASCLSLGCSAYTFWQVGVGSNFLIESNRVVFAQSDSSLTVLAIDSGAVLERRKRGDFSGRLKRVPFGILLLQYSSISLLDATNFSTIWQTDLAYEPNVLENSLVSYDGNGVVARRNLNDGTVRWTFSLPGALEVVAEGDKVLINRAATYEKKNVPALVMLDLESGKEIFRKTPPDGIQWPKIFFDGQNVYIEEGAFSGKRSDYELENLVVWSAQGQEIRRIPLDEKTRKEIRFSDSPFDLDQKTFFQSHVYSNRWSISSERFGKICSTENQSNGVTCYNLDDGFAFTERCKYSAGGQSYKCEVELESPEGHWEGVLAYLSKGGRISAIARISDRILLGTDRGQVECINARTGESLWLYVFPTIRQTLSYSSPYGMPPMMSQAAKLYRDDNRTIPQTGLQLLNQNSRRTRVIVDPEPADPFHDLPGFLAITWGGAVVPLLVLIFLHMHRRTRTWTLAPLSALLTVVPFACFMQFGRVSPGSSVMLRIAILGGVVFGIADAIKCFRIGKWFIGAVGIGIALAFGWLLFPSLMRI